jgi:hypothetical protein
MNNALLYVRYHRYNDNTQEKIDRKIEKARALLPDETRGREKVVTYGTSSGSRLSKSEITRLSGLITSLNYSDVFLYYCDETSLMRLCQYLKNEGYVCEHEETRLQIEALGGQHIYVNILEKERGINTEKKLIYLLKLFEVLHHEGESGIIPEEEDSFFMRGSASLSSSQLKRYLEELHTIFPDYVEKHKVGKKNRYRLKRLYPVIEEIIEKTEAIEELMLMMGVLDSETLQKLSTTTREAISDNKAAVMYRSQPFESFKDNDMFADFKYAIKYRLYIDVYDYQKIVPELEEYKDENYYDVLPLKIIYMENNWYLAGAVKVASERIVRFFRLRFIGDYKIQDKHFDKSEIKEEFLQFLQNFRTLMSRYGVRSKYVRLKVSAAAAPYFDGKKHFPGQSDLYFNDDGSAVMTVEYTQIIEVLPLIKKWIPDIEVLESENAEVEKALKESLERSLEQIEKSWGV